MPRRPDDEEMYDRAVAFVLRRSRVSTTLLMRHVRYEDHILGYNRSALFLARMEIEGIVGRIADDCRRAVLVRLQ